MAQYQALKSFGGKASATKGRLVELKDKAVIADLLSAGYIAAVGTETPADAKPEVVETEAPVETPAPEVKKTK